VTAALMLRSRLLNMSKTPAHFLAQEIRRSDMM